MFTADRCRCGGSGRVVNIRGESSLQSVQKSKIPICTTSNVLQVISCYLESHRRFPEVIVANEDVPRGMVSRDIPRHIFPRE